MRVTFSTTFFYFLAHGGNKQAPMENSTYWVRITGKLSLKQTPKVFLHFQVLKIITVLKQASVKYFIFWSLPLTLRFTLLEELTLAVTNCHLSYQDLPWTSPANENVTQQAAQFRSQSPVDGMHSSAFHSSLNGEEKWHSPEIRKE